MKENYQLADAKTAKEKLKNLAQDFLKSNKPSHTVNIKLNELLPLFAPLKLSEIKRGIVNKKATDFIIPSPRQRKKYSDIHDKDDKYKGSTWSEDGIASGLISWFTQVSTPLVKINVNTLNEFDVITVWDGESKFQITWHFLIKQAPDLFRVLVGKDNKPAPQVENFIEHSTRFETPYNKNLVNQLYDMFKKVEELQIKYVSVDWMVQNGYGELVNSLFSMEIAVMFQNLPEQTEGEAYHREGSVSAKQTLVQLTNSQMVEAWSDITRFDGNKPINLFKQALKKSIFAASPDECIFFQDVYANVHKMENYQGQEEYLYDFIQSHLFKIDDTKYKFGLSEYFSEKQLSGIARPFDTGTEWVFKQMKKYKEFVNNPKISQAKKDAFLKEFVKTFRLVETAFGYGGTSKHYTTGLLDSRIIKLFRPDKKSEELRQSQKMKLRTLLEAHGYTISRGPLGKIDKFILSSHLMIYVILYAISYTKKNTDENQLTDVMYEIIETIKKDWINYCFNFKIDSSNINLFEITDEKIEQVNLDTKQKTIYSMQNLPPFGCLYHSTGGNLEKVAFIFNEFLKTNVENRLKEVFSNTSSTATEKRRLKSFLQQKGIDTESFFMFGTESETLYSFDDFDIGHPKAESRGNILKANEFLFEEKNHNRYEYTTNSKDIKSYYRCLMANHNDILSERTNESASVLQKNPKAVKDVMDKLNEAMQAIENLKLILEFVGIEFDENESYVNGTVNKKEYILD